MTLTVRKSQSILRILPTINLNLLNWASFGPALLLCSFVSLAAPSQNAMQAQADLGLEQSSQSYLNSPFQATNVVLPSVLASDAFSRMQQAIKESHFSMSFVKVAGTKVNPWAWTNGVIDGKQVEFLISLNGPAQQIVRRDNVVTYLEQDKSAYSISGALLDGPLPSVLYAEVSELEKYYDFISVGSSRVAGRKAKFFRIVAKDEFRFSYWLWLDQKTMLPLKAATVSKQGELLEQFQVTTLQMNNTLDTGLNDVAKAELPPAFGVSPPAQMDQVDWQINWVPQGFTPSKIDKHRLSDSNVEVDYVMLTDGIVWFSVYIRELGRGEKVVPSSGRAGATTLLTERVGRYEITVIGEIPPVSAKRLALSVTPKRR